MFLNALRIVKCILYGQIHICMRCNVVCTIPYLFDLRTKWQNYIIRTSDSTI